MNTKKNRKAGFTLVELMVVAIIVAILAAVAIPLMSGNKDRAMATEAQAGCGTIATQVRLAHVEGLSVSGVDSLPGVNAGDLDGNYYDHDDYVLSYTTISNYNVVVSANATKGGGYVRMTVAPGAKTEWIYTAP